MATRVGHQFSDPSVLARAMAHRSWCAEHPETRSNERLEFLGDAVLGWVVADLAFHRFPDLSEGSLTGVRKGVVNAAALADAARVLGIGDFLLLGKGEDAAGGRDKASILSDAFEAVIGALYVDGGPEAAARFVEDTIGPAMDAIVGRLDHLDHKSRLQELAARAGLGSPVYRSEASGPDHEKHFVVWVLLGGEPRGQGAGRSKKVAEQAAAEAAATSLEAQLAAR
ncbi:MAG: ribonuclease III [Desertimonas sp.]